VSAPNREHEKEIEPMITNTFIWLKVTKHDGASCVGFLADGAPLSLILRCPFPDGEWFNTLFTFGEIASLALATEAEVQAAKAFERAKPEPPKPEPPKPEDAEQPAPRIPPPFLEYLPGRRSIGDFCDD
jgi:hypothetical protein